MERTINKVIQAVPRLPAKVRIAAYARVSSGKDAMLHSLSAQVSFYSKLIQDNPKWQYIGVYADEAYTGTKEDRPQFQQMLTDCRAGNIDMIITKSISRFARNTVTLLKTVRELKELNVDVYFQEQNIHSISADGELMLTILASYAQEESLSASENQKWRIRKGFENGELINLRFIYGYDINKSKIKINAKEAENVRYIFSSFLNGASLGSIAKKLNADGNKGVIGGYWSTQRIRDILANEKYTGNALLQKKYRNNHIDKKEIRNNGVLPQYYAEGTHEAIIDIETFNGAQELLNKVSEKFLYCKQKKKTVFSSIIYCPKCGKNYKRRTSNGMVGWNCSTFLQKGKSFCHGKKIPEDTLILLCNEVLDIASFDEDLFIEKVRQIVIPKPNHLSFILHNGEIVEKVWQERSRSESWTEEMRELARQRAIKQRREQL